MIKRHILIKVLVLFFILTLQNKLVAQEIIKLATTTSTYETGILDYILAPFEKAHNVKMHIISVGTGKAIKLGENGDVDVILVHDREVEDKFIKDGFGVNRRDVMYNEFVILGPEDDPAKIYGLKSAGQSFKKIYDANCAFVSRGDDSGTDKKEKSLWSKAGINPKGTWYIETGQGMNATLRIADEKKAYLMVDSATYFFNKDKIRLKKLLEGDEELFNPYGVIAVSPYKYNHVKYELAMAFIGWLTSLKCQQLIDEYKVNGYKLFHSKVSD